METKTCFKCGVDRPIEQFYRHSEMLDGHLNKCKECTKRDVRANRNQKAAYYREYDKGRSGLEKRVKARAEYARAHKHGRKRSALYKARYPLRYEAHNAVGNALRDGRLVKQRCEVCGSLRTQAHHPDYRKPLDVMWLCRKHHVEWHLHNEALPHSDDAKRRIEDAEVVDEQRALLGRKITPWSDEEMRVMIEMKRDGSNDAGIAERLGRSVASVTAKRKRLSREPF